MIKGLEHRLTQKELYQQESFKPDEGQTHNQEKISSLESEIRVLRREMSEKQKKIGNEKAVLEQRVRFLEQEKEDLQSKLTDRANREDSIMQVVKKRAEEEMAEIKKQAAETIGTQTFLLR